MTPDGGPAGPGSLRLLGANRPFRLLWTARTVSFAGDSLGLVALMLHVAETTGQALAVALLLLAGDFVPALFGPLAGTLADRVDRRRVMVGCELVQSALVVVIALWLPSLPLLLVLVGLRAAAAQVFQPASRAAVPALVAGRDLERANAAVGLGTNGGEALGPLLAAVALPVLGVRGVLLVDAATFLVSAALLGFLPAMPGAGPGRDRRAIVPGRRQDRAALPVGPSRRCGRSPSATSRSSPATASTTSPWCSWPPTPLAAATARSGCSWPPSASGCWPGTRCWPGPGAGSR